MAEARFNVLRAELLQAGVAPRHARRAVAEIESHFQQLRDECLSRGDSEDSARLEAHRRLGTNQEFVRQYAARAELQAWSRRWPSIFFMIVPSLIYLAAGFGALLTMSTLASLFASDLRRMHITPGMTFTIDLAAQVTFLWGLPLGVAVGFGLLAKRRYIALQWPFTCCVLVSILASLCNVAVKFTGGPGSGEVGAGIGFSMETVAGQTMHAAILVALSSSLLWMLRRSRGRLLN